jgi:hypothetical protein
MLAIMIFGIVKSNFIKKERWLVLKEKDRLQRSYRYIIEVFQIILALELMPELVSHLKKDVQNMPLQILFVMVVSDYSNGVKALTLSMIWSKLWKVITNSGLILT